ncbi:MAG: hypothetical protein P8P81_00295 [Bacteroidia bacterium]|jgi:hypothetical protein|nr:hypothetical protein [Bacteroidia bacterium]
MKNLIKVLSLVVLLSITFIACEEKKECKEECKKECCEKKEASSCDSEKEKACCKKDKKDCDKDKSKKACKDDKACKEEIDSNNITTENDVVVGDFVL